MTLQECYSALGGDYDEAAGRLRSDRLIQKIRLSDTAEADPYVALVKRLAVDDKLDFDTAKILIAAYREAQKKMEVE